MKEKTLKLIQKKHKYSSGHNGYSLVVLKNILKIDLINLKKILNELHEEKKIVVKKGINNKLIFWNENTNTKK